MALARVPSVAVVEFNVPLRLYLRQALAGAGYAVTLLPTHAAALDHLRGCSDPLVAVMGNATPDHRLEATVFDAIAAGGQPLLRHRYILLTTTPEYVPPDLYRQLAILAAPILKKPFDQDHFLTVVRNAVRSL